MKITYIHHSCFVLETPDDAIIFDYYKNGTLLEKIISSKRKIYVFSSHSHYDHFNPEIFKWASINKNIKYILSGDIRTGGLPAGRDTTFLKEGECFSDGSVEVKAYGSTDCGVSFWVEFGGKVIFHAGDLNNWHWNEEVSSNEAEGYSRAFLEKLGTIKREHTLADIVMFPTDPRLGRDFCMGAEQFISAINVHLFAPMHFQGNFEKANSFKKAAEKRGCEFFTINETGSSITIPQTGTTLS
jgi:L-ascorbate metabolism protein UlaG (beta-lactamase superfamily)